MLIDDKKPDPVEELNDRGAKIDILIYADIIAGISARAYSVIWSPPYETSGRNLRQD